VARLLSIRATAFLKVVVPSLWIVGVLGCRVIFMPSGRRALTFRTADYRREHALAGDLRAIAGLPDASTAHVAAS
jgi:hypothetical protein